MPICFWSHADPHGQHSDNCSSPTDTEPLECDWASYCSISCNWEEEHTLRIDDRVSSKDFNVMETHEFSIWGGPVRRLNSKLASQAHYSLHLTNHIRSNGVETRTKSSSAQCGILKQTQIQSSFSQSRRPYPTSYWEPTNGGSVFQDEQHIWKAPPPPQSIQRGVQAPTHVSRSSSKRFYMLIFSLSLRTKEKRTTSNGLRNATGSLERNTVEALWRHNHHFHDDWMPH